MGGEIEFWLGDEKHILTTSCLIFVPRGLKHCPLIIRRVDRPIFHFATGTKGTYVREKDSPLNARKGEVQTMAETQYGKYIITQEKAHMIRSDWDKDKGKSDSMIHLLSLDNEVLKGAFYLECAWFVKGSDKPSPEAHIHDFDEVIAFFGNNPEAPYDLGGEIEIWLGDEKHVITQSCLVFVPKGLKHCPLIIRRVDRPIFHFSTGPGGMYTGEKK